MDVKSRGVEGKTALHMVAQNNSKAVAEFLISKCAEINSKDDLGKTP